MPVPLRIGIAGVGHFGRYHALKVAAAERAALWRHFHNPDRLIKLLTACVSQYIDAA